MDLATIIGILVAFGSLYAMITLEGAHVESLLIPAPMVLVFGATIAIGRSEERRVGKECPV